MAYLLNYYETYTDLYEVEADNQIAAQEKLADQIRLGKIEGPSQCIECWCEPGVEENVQKQISRAMNKTLNLSTGHLTNETRERLTRCSFNNDYLPMCTIYEKSEYGWFIYIDDNRDEIDDLPTDLRDCINLALSYGVTCICFDRDAYELDALQKYA